MAVKVPTPNQIHEYAAAVGQHLSDDDVVAYGRQMAAAIAALDVLDAMPDPMPLPKWPRTGGVAPAPADNVHNAWYVRTSIKGASSGPLASMRVAIKDNMMVAGLPMMNGNAILEGYVPEIDATVVTRVLDAGAEIVGKTHCEDFCISGGSHTGAKGPVHNPWRRGYDAGGSSSGSAVVVATGEADLAFGGDQGGSIRMPACWCGIVGMKATYGLVPYTGIMPIEIVLDHTGPMSRTVADNALMLGVIAGRDAFDPRQGAVPDAWECRSALDAGARGLRVGVLKEGFDRPESEAAVDAKVRAAAERLRVLGALVEVVSVPEHLTAGALWTAIGVQGITQTMLLGDGYGVSRSDLYVTSLMDKLHGWQLRGDELSTTTRFIATLGLHLQKHHGTRFYAKAVNRVRALRAAYDAALARYDVLLMPTLPMKPTPLPPAGVGLEATWTHAFEMIGNTCPFNMSHHPALTVPCGLVDGLPVGAMLVGRHFDEATVYRAGQALERAGDWKVF